MNSKLYHFHQRFLASANFKFPRVTHFPRLSSKMGGAALPLCSCLCMGTIPFWIVGRTVCERGVLQGSRGLAPWQGSPPCLRKLCIWWAWDMQFHYPFSWVGGEHRIKYFQIILNNNFSLLSCQNWNYSKSCQLATFESPIGNFSVKNLNLISQNTTNFDQSCQLATQKSPIGNFLSNFNFG